MKNTGTQNTWKWHVLIVVLTLSLTPLVLTSLGVNFGSASRGGAGAHFAGWATTTHVVRIDVNAIGLLLLVGTLAFVYQRVRTNSVIAIFGITMVMSGLVDAIQIVPTFLADSTGFGYKTATVWTTLVGRFSAAALLMLGTLYLAFLPRTWKRRLFPAMAVAGLAASLTTWYFTASARPDAFLDNTWLNLGTIFFYTAVAGLLLTQARRLKWSFLAQFAVLAMVPFMVGQFWLLTAVHTIYDQGFHVAVMLKWMGWLLLSAGLGIDLINTFHAQGISQEKQFLRGVIDTIPHFVFARDRTGRFTIVNQSVARFYNKTPEQIEGRHLQEIHADLDQCHVWEAEDREILKSGEMVEIPEQVTHDADGTEMWVKAVKRPLICDEGGQGQVLGVSIDITPQKVAERTLAQRLQFEQAGAAITQAFVQANAANFEETMKRVLRHLAHCIGADRAFLYRLSGPNQDARLLFSWQGDTEGPETGLPAALSHICMDWMNQWFGLRVPISVDRLSHLPENAERFRKQWSTLSDPAFLSFPLHSNDRLLGFLGLDGVDIDGWSGDDINLVRYAADHFATVWTKLEAEKSLVAAMQEAQASSLAKSEFLANMSHEIRTPMNCIIGISELLMDMDPTEAQRQYLEMVSQSSNSLLALINDILDVSKIEAGKLEIDPVETNLRALVEEVAGLSAFQTQAKGVEMVCRIAPGVPDVVVCDPHRLRQVLTNLLNNATKFTADGHIYLNVEPVGNTEGKIRLRFAVQDTGIGIPPEKLEDIFEKFTQADASTTRKYGGTGLGLPISQHLVHLMGGRIEAESVIEQGTTFFFTLPLTVIEGVPDPAIAMTERDEAVLVITAHELGGEVLAEQVRNLGYPCTVAIGCHDALAMLPGPPFARGKVWSTVLIDQDVIEGEVPRIRQALDDLGPDLPTRLIMMTALSSTIREQELQKNGFNGTLPKPVRPQQLEAVLAGNLDEVTLGSEAESAPASPGESPVCPLTGGSADSSPIEEETGLGSWEPHVLLAEDNPFNQRVAVGMLEKLGCEVDVVGNGAEAVAAVLANSYDLVFMDCQMPELDGYEATRRIRALEDADKAATTIIAMTANALSGDRQACFEAGMNDFMSKPINKATLGDMLARWELHQTSV